MAALLRHFLQNEMLTITTRSGQQKPILNTHIHTHFKVGKVIFLKETFNQNIIFIATTTMRRIKNMANP